jgi:hypothetical protein
VIEKKPVKNIGDKLNQSAILPVKHAIPKGEKIAQSVILEKPDKSHITAKPPT